MKYFYDLDIFGFISNHFWHLHFWTYCTNNGTRKTQTFFTFYWFEQILSLSWIFNIKDEREIAVCVIIEICANFHFQWKRLKLIFWHNFLHWVSHKTSSKLKRSKVNNEGRHPLLPPACCCHCSQQPNIPEWSQHQPKYWTDISEPQQL